MQKTQYNNKQNEELDRLYSPRPTDWEWTRVYLEELRAHPNMADLSFGTRISYVQVIKRFLNHIKKDPGRVTKRKVQAYFNQIFNFNPKGLKGSTQHTYFAALRWYLTKVKGKKDFIIQLARVKKNPLPLVTTTEFKTLLNLTQCCYLRKGKKQHTCGHKGCKYQRSRNRLLLLFLWDTGCRISEAAAVRI